MLAALAGCSASPAAGGPARLRGPPEKLPAPLEIHESDDASYDWHGLLVVPFGSRLKTVPLSLHEVLLFRDQGRGSAAILAEDAECYAPDAGAPRFAGQDPYEYLLCFKQDRLTHIQAAVYLPPAQAPGVLMAACAHWLKAAASSGTSAGAAAAAAAPSAGAPKSDTPAGAACEGRDGAVRFSGRLGDQSAAQTMLSITLDSVADR